jgi:hypothetical protein
VSARRTVSLQMRLRPLRLAFLVRPDDDDAIRAAIEVNTVRWGGQFNALVPVFRRTPSWWGDACGDRSPANSIVRGYIEAFEPDYVVETRKGLGEGLDVEEGFLLSMEDVLSSERDDSVGFGISVMELYRHLYHREFQFVRRDPGVIAVPQQADPSMAPFVAAVFGGFPRARKVGYFESGYREAFEAKEMSVVPSNLFKFALEIGTPLKMGKLDLEVRGRGRRADPALFFLDGNQPRDLIDFWNLRALGRLVIPIPKQWANDLLNPIQDFIRKNNIPYRHNASMRHSTTLLKSRSVPDAEFDRFTSELGVGGEHALAIQRWYPRIWDTWARDKDHALRCDVVAEEVDHQCELDDQSIEFLAPAPKFAERYAPTSDPRWAVVVRIRDYQAGSELAAVLPPGLRDLDRVLSTRELRSVTACTEGIVLRTGCKRWTHRWTLPDGSAVFRAWLSGRGLDSTLSGAGKIALRVIRTLGGYLHPIAHVGVLKKLDEMSHGIAEFPIEDGEADPKKRRARGAAVPANEWLGLLQRVNRGDLHKSTREMEALTSKGVLQVGLRLRCTNCNQMNWYPLDDLDEDLRCERCLGRFRFPAAKPPKGDAWAYRTQGAFSVENYAQGGYAVALALGFLTHGLGAQATWTPNIEIKGPNGPLEIDFAAWWRKWHFDSAAPSLILGECKSFGEAFGKMEVARAQELARIFPGAALAFVTLREALEPKEKHALGRLAMVGRRYLAAEKWRTPVLVLTAHELMSPMGVPICWQEAGGQFAKFARQHRGSYDLEDLCDATQQLHLGLEPFSQWQHREFEKRRAGWSKRHPAGP